MKYFSYDPCDNNFTLHETAAEAKKSAEEALEYERYQACSEGWAYYVDKICWGELLQQVVETVRRPRTHDDTFVASPEFDAVVDYGLVDVCAAPDLLSALENLVNSLVESDEEGLIEHVEAIEAARAAIANNAK